MKKLLVYGENDTPYISAMLDDNKSLVLKLHIINNVYNEYYWFKYHNIGDDFMSNDHMMLCDMFDLSTKVVSEYITDDSRVVSEITDGSYIRNLDISLFKYGVLQFLSERSLYLVIDGYIKFLKDHNIENNIEPKMRESIDNTVALEMISGLVYKMFVYGENGESLVSLMHDHLGAPVLKRGLYAGPDTDDKLNIYCWVKPDLVDSFMNGHITLNDLCMSSSMVIHETITDGVSQASETQWSSGFLGMLQFLDEM